MPVFIHYTLLGKIRDNQLFTKNAFVGKQFLVPFSKEFKFEFRIYKKFK